MSAPEDADAVYLAEHVRARLATDERTSLLGLEVCVELHRLVIRGVIPAKECREAIERVAEEMAAPVVIVNETTVMPAADPGPDLEVIR